MKLNPLHALGVFLLIAISAPVSAHNLEVSNAWVRAAPPNAPALGVFMDIENHSASELAIVGARTTLEVERVELHRTMKVGEVMKMVPQQNIPMDGDSSIRLKPGSWHIMLIGPAEIPAVGDEVTLTLELSDGSEQQVSAIVRKGKKMKHQHKHGHGKGHGQGMNQE